MEKVIKAFCGRVCTSGCGILVTVKDGKITQIKGDPDCPLNRGIVCPKGLSLPELLYHPDRLRHPMKRAGGKGKWQRLSWEETLSIIAEKLNTFKEKFGAESVLIFLGMPKGLEISVAQRFATVFGTPNIITPGSICHMPRDLAGTFTYGSPSFPDYEHPPACLMVWGSNIGHTNEGGVTIARFRPALDQGSKLIVIDPRKNTLASRAHIWLKPRPGSDGLVALGMLKLIVNHQLYDREFVTHWTQGFEELKGHLESYSLKQIEELTWVPQTQLEEATRLYAITKPSAIHWGNALEHSSNSFQTCRAICILRAITGNLDIPGGDVLPAMPRLMRPGDFMLLRDLPRNQEQMLGSNFKIAAQSFFASRQLAIKAILDQRPYPVKAALIFGSNPILSFPNSKEVHKALNKLEFLVVSELFMTPTAELADIVLPAATILEFDEIGHYAVRLGFSEARTKVVEPPGECWSDIKIMNELAKKLGLGKYFWADEKEALDLILKPSGLTFDKFKEIGILFGDKKYRKYENEGFRTPSGKVEIYSSQLQELGSSPLPTYTEPKETPFSSPVLAQEYPLIMTSYKSPFFTHSSHRQIAKLRQKAPEPVAELNPQTAKKLGLKEGEWVYIETPRGKIRQKLQLNKEIDPRAILVGYGWWFPERKTSELYAWQESNINLLTDSDPPYEPAVGSTNLRGLPCKVYKAK